MFSRSVVVLSVLSKIPKRNGMYVCMYAGVVVVVAAAAAAAAVIIVIDGRFVVSLWRSGAVRVWCGCCGFCRYIDIDRGNERKDREEKKEKKRKKGKN